MPAHPRERLLLHLGGAPATWGNLGLWPATAATDYASACAALATAVGRAGRAGPGARVLSVACGAGDELLWWDQHFGAGQVVGLEHDTTLAQAARGLVSRAGRGADIDVWVHDARSVVALRSQDAFDSVLCVDAAYHLSPRRAFIAEAFALLRPGGWLAYTDLVVERPADRPWAAHLLRAAARLSGVPAEDLADEHAGAVRLGSAGFVDMHIERLDDAVLGGFARFVRQQASRLGADAWRAGWRRPAVTARLIPLCRAAGLGYALFSARKPGKPGTPSA